MNVKVHLSTSQPTEHRHQEGPQPALWHRLSVNITLTERIGRIAIGMVAVVVGAILLTSAGSALAVVLAATHVISIAFLFYAVLCTAMMGGMMWAMNHGGMKV